MKDITGVVTRSGNVNADNAVACTIDVEGMGHIMSILSNMYSNAPLAVLREYACNARDSHIASGQTRPVEVTLPSALQPSLLIQDYGLGLSKDEIVAVYATYGKSTKRDTNDQVGAFGIGSKSAFTMGQQFVVTGIKDGWKTVALFALNEANVGTVNILHDEPTTEPNGVLVSLAVEDVDRMRETAEEFFGTWKPGTVLVNGQEPESVYGKGFDVNEKVHVIPDTNGEVVAVMGAVGYPVSRDIMRKVSRNLITADRQGAEIAQQLAGWAGGYFAVYLDVEIGDVDIAPTRESLRDTPRTLRVLEDLVESIAVDLLKSVEDKVTAAKTWRDAYQALQDAREMLNGFNVPLKGIQWQGHDLKDAEVDLPVVFQATKSNRSVRKFVMTDRKFTVSLDREPKVCVVTGVTDEDLGKVTRFAKRFLEEHDYQWILLSESAKGKFDWFRFGHKHDDVKTYTLDEYREVIKSLRVTRPRVANEPSYDQGMGTASKELADRTPLSEILESGQDIVVFEGSTPNRSWMLDEVLKDRELIVLLPTQSRDALIKRVGDEVEVLDGYAEIRNVAQAAVDSITDAEREVLAAKSAVEAYEGDNWASVRKFYSKVMDDIVNDEFKGVFDTYDEAKEVYQAGKAGLERALEAAAWLNKAVTTTGSTKTWEIPSLGRTYPLLPTERYYWDSKSENDHKRVHGVMYLNGIALSK